MKENLKCTELMLLLTLTQKNWIREKAKEHGLTMNGFLKTLINKEMSKEKGRETGKGKNYI